MNTNGLNHCYNRLTRGDGEIVAVDKRCCWVVLHVELLLQRMP